MRDINSVYEVTDFKTGQGERVIVSGVGEKSIVFLRKQYKRHTKFVLEGFEIDSTFVSLKLRR